MICLLELPFGWSCYLAQNRSLSIKAVAIKKEKGNKTFLSHIRMLAETTWTYSQEWWKIWDAEGKSCYKKDGKLK